ncbi:mechanosensitive ion channel family protein [Citricoccus nitrophenolicus]|uniref:Small-conductance mechanosensitive channel n=1 Tax=Citricoccus muralis TaxID=169134 RepID=A0A3D9LCJ8_9MICC|nr:mechanosensitive ion channel family protein [Citricoccus muralis]REE04131.1 small-conductance mechanosensitive channel [Citricoccus muralis]
MPSSSFFTDLFTAPPATVLTSGAGLDSESTADPSGSPENVQDSVREGAEGAVDSLGPFWGMLSTVAISVAFALAVLVVAWLLVNALLRRKPQLRNQVARCRVPVAVAAVLLAVRIALGLTASTYAWFNGANFLLMAGIIGSLAWLALRVVRIVEERLLGKYASEGVDDRRDRKIRTQTVLLRRVIQAAVIVIAVSIVLLTIPQVRAVGAGLLASAGVISVVAGLAVQSTLTNVFAGIQLAFTDAIRVGDVVIADGVYGTIEDITLSYVVVKIWDGRRVIYPSSHFTTTPFENWTRTGSALSGTVEIDVDWRVPVDATRERLKALLESTELWDGKDSTIQVSEALGGTVKLWVAVSARNAGDLWDLRCLVREDLVNFLRSEHPEAIYAQRFAEMPVQAPSLAPVGAEPGAVKSSAGEPGTGVPAGQDHDGGASGGASGGAAGGAAALQPRTPTSPLPQVNPGTGQQPTTGATTAVTGSTPLTRSSDDSTVFTGSITAVERNREFAGPGEAAFAERKEKAAEADRAESEPGDGAAPDSAEDGEPQRRPGLDATGNDHGDR